MSDANCHLAQIIADGFQAPLIKNGEHEFAWPQKFEANLRLPRQDMYVSGYDSAHVRFAVCRALQSDGAGCVQHQRGRAWNPARRLSCRLNSLSNTDSI